MTSLALKRLIVYFTVPLIATAALLLTLYLLPTLERTIPSKGTRYLFIVVVFFTIVYIAQRLVFRYGKARP